MFEDLAGLVTEHGFNKIYPFIVLLALRPFGLLFGFVAMTWAFGKARMLRVSIALAIGLPLLVPNFAVIEQLAIEADVLKLVMIAPKELMIGYALGFLASVPFFALQYAGAITDGFRGESDSGVQDPDGGQLTTFGTLYLIVGFAAFFLNGGMWHLVENLYRSFDIWPMGYVFPSMSLDAAGTVLGILTSTLILAIQVALPLLAVLVALEFSLSIGARISRRFNLYDLAFPVKNLTAILLLPIVAWFVWVHSSDIVTESGGNLTLLEALFK